MTSTATLNFRSEASLTLKLNDVNFYCQFTKSENGKNIIAYHDGDPFAGIGGYRKKGKGFYFIIKSQELVHIGQVERPNDGKIANNGFFIINDWLFDTGTQSIAYAFDTNGEIIFKKRLSANLLNNGISASGNFALFKTCNSNSSDHNVLFLVDLQTKDLVWKKHFCFRNPDSYTIIDNRLIKLNYKDSPTVVLDWDMKHCGYENNIG